MPDLLISVDWCTYFKSGLIKSTKSPTIVVSSFTFPVGVSWTAPAAISIETVPLQSLYSFAFLAFSKSDNTNVYVCPTTTFPLVLSVISVCDKFGVRSVVSTPSTKTLISFIVNKSVVSRYLSVTVNTIVSVAFSGIGFPASPISYFWLEIFTISGLIKSTCPNVNSVAKFLLPDWSVIVSADTSITVVPLNSL